MKSGQEPMTTATPTEGPDTPQEQQEAVEAVAVDPLEGLILLEPRDVYDKAIIGRTSSPRDHWRRETKTPVAVYSRRKCVRAMMKAWGWTAEDAWEWQEYNVEGAWVGEGTPTFRA